MNLFGKKHVMVVYSCARKKSSRGVYLDGKMTYNFILGLRDLIDMCQKEDEPCPESCEIKRLLDQYSGDSGVEIKY